MIRFFAYLVKHAFTFVSSHALGAYSRRAATLFWRIWSTSQPIVPECASFVEFCHELQLLNFYENLILSQSATTHLYKNQILETSLNPIPSQNSCSSPGARCIIALQFFPAGADSSKIGHFT